MPSSFLLCAVFERAHLEECAFTPPHCEERCTRVGPLLDRIEALLDRGDAREAMRRLGRWVASDPAPLGPRGVSLLVRAALELGRMDIAYIHSLTHGARMLPVPELVVA